MSTDSTQPVPKITSLPAVAATRALVEHGNGDHRPDERGPQPACPSCRVEAA